MRAGASWISFITAEEQARFMIGVKLPQSVEVPKGFGIYEIPSGEYAVFRFKGSYHELNSVYRHNLPRLVVGKRFSTVYTAYAPVRGGTPSTVNEPLRTIGREERRISDGVFRLSPYPVRSLTKNKKGRFGQENGLISINLLPFLYLATKLIGN